MPRGAPARRLSSRKPTEGSGTMPKVSKQSAAEAHDHGVVEEWREDVDGYTVNFVAFRQDIDGKPLLAGLPGDRCQGPHWGYALKGRLPYRFAGHEEVFEAGDAFFLPPGHVPLAEAGSEIMQFSPTEPLKEVDEAMMRNMQAAMQA